MHTSGTLPDDRATFAQGTDSRQAYGLNYVPLPPKAELPATSYWTIEKVVTFGVSTIGVLSLIVTIVIFFINMGRDVSDIKSNVKDQGIALRQLSEKTDKNAFDIQTATDALRNLIATVGSRQGAGRK